MTPGNKISKLILETAFLAVSAMLLYAPFFTGDYSYYEILRIVVCGLSAYFSLITLTNQDGYFANENSKYPFMFVIIAIIFNPVLPIHLSREAWAPIDIVSGIAFIFYFFERKTYHRKNKQIREQQERIEREQDEEYYRIRNTHWCKTCAHYRKSKVYEDSISGKWKSSSVPNNNDLPCNIAEISSSVWLKYYSIAYTKRTLYPKECSYWKKN